MDINELKFLQKNGLIFITIIARGGYGIIYQVHSEQYHEDFALKKIPEKLFSDQEIECLIAIDDSRIVHLYKYFRYNGFIYLLMEFCTTDLQRIFKEHPNISNEICKAYIIDVVKAVKACHDRNVAHCDIKPANFLVDSHGRIKIGDFGLSKIYTDIPRCLDYKGSGFYMSPEIFGRRIYNPFVSDMWALGVTLYLLHTRRFPFEATNEREFLLKIQKGKYNTDRIQDPLLAEVIAHCLIVNPAHRATIDELLQLEYFTTAAEYISPSASHRQIVIFGKNNEGVLKPKVSRRKLPTVLSASHNLFKNSSFQRLQIGEISRSAECLSLLDVH